MFSNINHGGHNTRTIIKSAEHMVCWHYIAVSSNTTALKSQSVQNKILAGWTKIFEQFCGQAADKSIKDEMKSTIDEISKAFPTYSPRKC